MNKDDPEYGERTDFAPKPVNRINAQAEARALRDEQRARARRQSVRENLFGWTLILIIVVAIFVPLGVWLWRGALGLW